MSPSSNPQDPFARDQHLLDAIKAHLPRLEELQKDMEQQLEAGIYRYYHASFKIYGYQEYTRRAVAIFEDIGRGIGRPLNELFTVVMREGTHQVFEARHNQDWSRFTRPIVEALLHARYFVDMMVKYGHELADVPNPVLPYGWAAILELSGQR